MADTGSNIERDVREIRDFMAASRQWQESTSKDIQEVRDQLKSVNGTVRAHGEKLAAHDTYLGLNGFGAIGAIIMSIWRLLVK